MDQERTKCFFLSKRHKNIIKLDDQISLEMKWPSFNSIVQDNVLSSESNVDQIFQKIKMDIMRLQVI